eukprot:scaffold168696_cov17-Tisochrysis_lutea.AAC.1
MGCIQCESPHGLHGTRSCRWAVQCKYTAIWAKDSLFANQKLQKGCAVQVYGDQGKGQSLGEPKATDGLCSAKDQVMGATDSLFADLLWKVRAFGMQRRRRKS